jgi:hypothetical protein
MDERRRHPRRPVDHETASMPAMLTVQVLDITADGALLQAARPVAVGTRAMFRLNLGGTMFNAEMLVQRVAPAPGGALGVRIGASFINVAPGDRQLIERFVNEA